MDEEQLEQANRVLQLESNNLNCMIDRTIDQITDSLNIPKFSEEVKLLLKLYVFSSHIRNLTTVGMKVYNLNYREVNNLKQARAQIKGYKLIILTTCNLLVPYLLRRYNYVGSILKQGHLGKLKFTWLTLDNLTLFFKSLNLINFLAFLSGGRYLLIQERILGITSTVSVKDNYNNSISNKLQMELLNRDTIWKAFADFFAIVLPYINFEKIKNHIFKLTNFNHKFDENLCLANKLIREGSLKQCAICGNQPFNPHVIGCRHVFCYYCLMSKYLLDPTGGFTCLTCNYKNMDQGGVVRLKIHHIDNK